MEADYIIVGGGLSGCAIASRIKQSLSEASVLVLEAGSEPSEKHDIITPQGGFALSGSELDWQFRTQPVPSTDDRTYTLVAGKTLGGGSSLNYGNWARADAADYDDWARLLNDQRWSYSQMLPYFKRTERFLHNDDADANSDRSSENGFDGVFKITAVQGRDPAKRYPLRNVFEQAWTELGTPRNFRPGCGKNFGVCEMLENWHRGKRQPSHLAYPMQGIEVLASCPVSKIIFDQNRIATGLTLTDNRHYRARREIILSAGAFQTPLILLRSGIGPAGILDRYNIPLVHAAPGVGANYIDHFALYQTWKLKESAAKRGLALGHPNITDPSFFGGLPSDWVVNESPPRELLEAALNEDGVLGAERESLLQPGRVYVETLILYTVMRPDLESNGSYISSSVMLTLPLSRGKVSLSPPPPPSSTTSTVTTSGPDANLLPVPHIEPNFFTSAFDRLCLTWSARRLLNLMLATETMKDVVESETPPPGFPPLSPSSTDAEILDRIRRTGRPHFHAGGTCAAGQVLDTQLRVHGVKGVRVCDGSMFPAPLGGHPMANLYGIAERGAAFVIEDDTGSQV